MNATKPNGDAVMSDNKMSGDEHCPNDECKWTVQDDSFDHEFGTHHIPEYLECNVCPRTMAMPEPEY